MRAAVGEKVTTWALGGHLRLQPEPLDGRTRQTDPDVPLRLDEALKYAVARIEKDPRKIEIIISFLGWGGGTAPRVQELSRSVGLNSEQVVPIVACAIERLRHTGFVPE